MADIQVPPRSGIKPQSGDWKKRSTHSTLFLKFFPPALVAPVIQRHAPAMNLSLRSIATLACASTLALCPQARAQDPEAARILEGARMAATLTVLDEALEGKLLHKGRSTPLALFLKGNDIQFQFTENNQPKNFHMRLGEGRYDLLEITNGKTSPFPPARIIEPIAGTDLTYEDLSLRFFYWPGAILEGEERVKGEACHKIRLNKPNGEAGRYETVYVWVHTRFGAFMRIRGHDRSGGLLKEFEVEDVMQVAKDVWTLRKMRVSSHDPSTGRRSSITDVTFSSPKKAAPRRLR